MIKSRVLLFLVLLLFSGCRASSPEAISSQPNSTSANIEYRGDYQAAYEIIRSRAVQCLKASYGPWASGDVDAELYPNLGYATVTWVYVATLANSYFWTAKFEKKNSEYAVVRVDAMNKRYIDIIDGWLKGSKKCNGQ